VIDEAERSHRTTFKETNILSYLHPYPVKQNILRPHVIDIHGLQQDIINQFFFEEASDVLQNFGDLSKTVYEESEKGSLSDSDSDASQVSCVPLRSIMTSPKIAGQLGGLN
jgi:hypothetical protein